MRLAALVAAALFAVPGAALAHGGFGEKGDGNVVTRQREVPAFDRIRLEGSAEVKVKVGEGPGVAVTVDGNLQEIVVAEVKGGTLVVGARKSMRPTKGPLVEVSVPELRRFDLAGSGDVSIEGGKGDLELRVEGSGDLVWRGEAAALRAEVRGSGDVRLEGQAERLRAEVEGSGDIDASGLAARSAQARVHGSGDVELRLDGGELDATVEGSGDVRWRGKASVERARVAGSGEISRRD